MTDTAVLKAPLPRNDERGGSGRVPLPENRKPPVTQESENMLNERAFARDLPELLKGCAGQWVAYVRGERACCCPTADEAYRTAQALGDPFVRLVVPDWGPAVFLTPV